MRDHRHGVKLSGTKEPSHLDPGGVHLPASDTVEREPLEDDVASEVHFGGPARRAEHVDPAAGTRRAERLDMSVGVSAHLTDQVDADAASQFLDPGDDVILGRIEGVMRPHLGCQVTPERVEIRSQHQRGPRRPEHPDGEAADRAAPQHQRGAAGDVSPLQGGVDAVADRVHDGTDLGGDPVELHHVRDRHGDVVGEGAVAVDPDDRRPDTEMTVAGATWNTVAADDVPFGGDQVTDGEQSFGARFTPKFDDLAGKLMTDGDRWSQSVGRPAVPLPDVKVGAAHAGMMDADEHVSRTTDRSGALDEFHSNARGCLYNCAHETFTGKGTAKICRCRRASPRSPEMGSRGVFWFRWTFVPLSVRRVGGGKFRLETPFAVRARSGFIACAVLRATTCGVSVAVQTSARCHAATGMNSGFARCCCIAVLSSDVR